MRAIRPRARTEGLLSEQVDDEVLVFDERHEVACRLNASAALVWRSCDGKRTVADLVAVLSQELSDVADEDLVMVALDNLAEHGLIEAGYDRREASAARLTRRRFIRRVGIAGLAAMTIPVVHSMVVPAPSAAASGAGYTAYYADSSIFTL